jgi:hypothetical protein
MRKSNLCLILSAVVLIAILYVPSVWAVPRLINYQGYLTDGNGNPLDGIYLMNLNLYIEDTGGTPLWTEQKSVTVEGGIFNVLLGSKEPFVGDEFDNEELYLEVEIFNTGTGWEPLQPRQKLTSTAFAMKAAVADSVKDGVIQTDHIATGAVTVEKIQDGATISEILDDDGMGSGLDSDLLDGQDSSAFSPADHSHDTRYFTESESNSRFVNTAGDNMSGSTASDVLTVTNEGADSKCVGLTGSVSCQEGRGVVGKSTGLSGYGVYGIADDTTGRGVVGWAQGSYGFGVYGTATNEGYSENYGGYFQAKGGLGRGVVGRATNPEGENYGGYFTAAGTDGRGVYGEASNNGDVRNYGGYFKADGKEGRGVHGEAWGELGIGVFGIIEGDYGCGVYGSGFGPDRYSGCFDGKVRVSGYLTKSGGGFKIDHPLEPDTKYLNHSFVESPDMMNIYNGNIILNNEGEAWVELPGWFEALNRDFRYQLTCIGGFAQVYIAEKIADNRFKISGGKPEMEVSWQVTGIRQDPWANDNRPSVEEDKTEKEIGYYLHPESYGQYEEKGVEWVRHPKRIKRIKQEREYRRASNS